MRAHPAFVVGRLAARDEATLATLIDKIMAYELQDQGKDTVEANEALGFKADQRDYGIGAQILYDLGVRRMRLLTNNPKKVEDLRAHGLQEIIRVKHVTGVADANRAYLEAKRDWGHDLEDGDLG